MALATIALPTFADKQPLFGDSSVECCAERWPASGVREVVVKLGADGCLIADRGGKRLIPTPAPVAPLIPPGPGTASTLLIATRIAVGFRRR